MKLHACILAFAFFFDSASGQDDACSTKTQYINCFQQRVDGHQNVFLPVRLTDDDQNTPVACAARCKQAGYVYTGTMNGTQCYCGNMEPWDKYKSAAACSVVCPGDANETCGGSSTIQVYYVYKDGCDWMKILESTEDPVGQYHASNVLINGCGDKDTYHTIGNVTWWMPPYRGTNLNAYFTVELGCKKIIDRVVLKQSLAFPGGVGAAELLRPTAYGRGTKDFCVSVSEEGEHWDDVICGSLTADYTKTCDELGDGTVTYIFAPRPVKYGRFVVKTYLGYGGVLEYFDLRGPPPTCD